MLRKLCASLKAKVCKRRSEFKTLGQVGEKKKSSPVESGSTKKKKKRRQFSLKKKKRKKFQGKMVEKKKKMSAMGGGAYSCRWGCSPSPELSWVPRARLPHHCLADTRGT